LWNETEIIFNSNYAVGEICFQANEKPPQKDLVGAIVQKLPQKLSAQRTAKGPISISECCPDGEYIIIENTSKRNDINMTNWLLTHCVGSVRKVSFKFPENFVLKSKQSCKLWAGGCRQTSTATTVVTPSSPTTPTGNTPSPTSRMNKSSFSYSSSLSSSSSSLSNKSSVSPNSSSSAYGNGLSTNGFYLNGGTNGVSGATCSSSSTNGIHHNSNGAHGLNDVESIDNELIVFDIENWTYGSQEIFIRLENEFGEEKASFKKTN
jgi:hypothetical protein